MKRLIKLFRQPETAVLLFLLCLILFNWHYLGLPGQAHGYGTYVYLFSAWAAVIAVLFLMERATRSAEGGQGNAKTNESEDRDV